MGECGSVESSCSRFGSSGGAEIAYPLSRAALRMRLAAAGGQLISSHHNNCCCYSADYCCHLSLHLTLNRLRVLLCLLSVSLLSLPSFPMRCIPVAGCSASIVLPS